MTAHIRADELLLPRLSAAHAPNQRPALLRQEEAAEKQMRAAI